MKHDLELPERAKKPRLNGRTNILDKGLGLAALSDLLDSTSGIIDLAKLGWGTALVTDNVIAKIQIYQDHGVDVCLGGTLFELYYLQGRVDAYIDLVRSLGLTHVEVSDGTVAIEASEKQRIIRDLSTDFVVLSEVGSKDADAIVSPARWLKAINGEIEAGAAYVILEGRESGTAGMYRQSGEIRMGLIDEIIEAGVPKDLLIFEAPKKAQQVWLLKHLGTDINLANIPPEEVIPLETLRLGLRGDTLVHVHGSH